MIYNPKAIVLGRSAKGKLIGSNCVKESHDTKNHPTTLYEAHTQILNHPKVRWPKMYSWPGVAQRSGLDA